MPTFNETRKGYANLWREAEIRTDWEMRVSRVVAEIRANRESYEEVAELTGVPWELIGALHSMESGCNFKTHLHNGDSLNARTHKVPAGHPHAPPANGYAYTWVESACDALRLHNLHLVPEWPIERMLFEAERFNGFGYFDRGVNSPYVWSGTTLYKEGKYVDDGIYDPDAVSRQVGVAAILKGLLKEDEEEAKEEEEDIVINEETEDTATLEETKERHIAMLTQFLRIAPTLIEAIVDNGTDKPVADKILAEKVTEVSGDIVPVDNATAALFALNTVQITQLLREAEDLFVSIVHPHTINDIAAEAPEPAPAPVTGLDKLFGEKMVGWKTYIAIAGAVIVNVLAVLGVMPGVLTPDVVKVLDLALAGIGGASIISKIERFFLGFRK